MFKKKPLFQKYSLVFIVASLKNVIFWKLFKSVSLKNKTTAICSGLKALVEFWGLIRHCTYKQGVYQVAFNQSARNILLRNLAAMWLSIVFVDVFFFATWLLFDTAVRFWRRRAVTCGTSGSYLLWLLGLCFPVGNLFGLLLRRRS